MFNSKSEYYELSSIQALLIFLCNKSSLPNKVASFSNLAQICRFYKYSKKVHYRNKKKIVFLQYLMSKKTKIHVHPTSNYSLFIFIIKENHWSFRLVTNSIFPQGIEFFCVDSVCGDHAVSTFNNLIYNLQFKI